MNASVEIISAMIVEDMQAGLGEAPKASTSTTTGADPRRERVHPIRLCDTSSPDIRAPMPIAPPRPARRLIALALAACAVLAVAAAPASAAYDASDPVQQAQYDAAFTLAAQGYEYGIPLLNMDRTFRTSTSVNVSNGRGGGPVNQFNHFTRLADAKDRTVVAPNSDTLYSMAWLDLSKGPVVVHTAKGTKRFHVLELLSPYEENFANIGSPAHSYGDGDYLVAPKGWKGRMPKGLKKISSPYTRVWIIGRTLVYGQADVKHVRKIQDTYRIVPLKKWNLKKPYAYTPPKPKKPDRTINDAHVPGTATGEDAAIFFDALGDQLKRFPPPKADTPMLAKLKTLGIGPGLHPVAGGTLTDAQLQAMRDAVTQGPAKMNSNFVNKYLEKFDALNGWLATRTGTYGTDYTTRATVDKVGLGAPLPWVAVYPLALFDHTRAPLTGARRYVAHFTSQTSHPPVKFFWSMTLYDNDGFFVDNVKNRYLVNDRSRLRYNSDGSLDIYIQPTMPTDPTQARNWLPSPPASSTTRGFRLLMRLYGLSDSAIEGVVSGSGWHGPSLLPCADDGTTSAGIACAK
jgi:hypothetical protein